MKRRIAACQKVTQERAEVGVICLRVSGGHAGTNRRGETRIPLTRVGKRARSGLAARSGNDRKIRESARSLCYGKRNHSKGVRQGERP